MFHKYKDPGTYGSMISSTKDSAFIQTSSRVNGSASILANIVYSATIVFGSFQLFVIIDDVY